MKIVPTVMPPPKNFMYLQIKFEQQKLQNSKEFF